MPQKGGCFKDMNKSFSILCVLLLSLTFGCNRQYSSKKSQRLMDDAMSVVNEQPDSSLRILSMINRESLSEEDMARYCLLYYMSQDKSGINVDNDSLIRIAYNYYVHHEDDSLSAKCMYYMGEYYRLSDSTDRSVSCLRHSISLCDRFGDKPTKCLALGKLSILIALNNPRKAIAYAKQADSIYSTVEDADVSNKVYYKLNLVCCMSYIDDLRPQALNECKKAVTMALDMGDSAVILDTYIDLALVYNDMDMADSVILATDMASKYAKGKDTAILFHKTYAYIELDSLSLAYSLLGEFTGEEKNNYAYYDLARNYFLKQNNSDSVMAYSDSILSCLEKDYKKALTDKQSYYVNLFQGRIKNIRLEDASKMKSHIIVVISIAAFIICGLLSCLMLQRRKQARRQLYDEAQKAELEIKHKEELHRKDIEAQKLIYNAELSSREKQIGIVRDFLLYRMDILKKLGSAAEEEHGIMQTESGEKEGKKGKIKFTTEDWKSIEAFLNGTDNLFVTRIRERFPELTDKDLKLLMLLRLKMPAKTLATIYGISEKSVKQNLFLFKKKVGIDGQNKSLREFVETF